MLVNRRKNHRHETQIDDRTSEVMNFVTSTGKNKRIKCSMNSFKIGIGVLLLLSSANHYFIYLHSKISLAKLRIPESLISENDITKHQSDILLDGEKSDEKLEFDAFGIAEKLSSIIDEEKIHLSDKARAFLDAAHSIRDEFSQRYGGERAARSILQTGVAVFDREPGIEMTTNNKIERVADSSVRLNDFFLKAPESLKYTAHRIYRARKEGRNFQFAFAGYSITAGRGNYFHQSFPFVMNETLYPLMNLLGVNLEVRNAAIGGIPSFPYGWCLRNFLGENPDVISWDYAMNEPNGVPQGFEAYLRQALSLPNPPKLLVKDTHMATRRQKILKDYVRMGLMKDPVVIQNDLAAEPFLTQKEESRPIGFRKWREYGAPPDAPGKARHHPAVKEHQFIGWIISMHFLASIEFLLAYDLGITTFSHDQTMTGGHRLNLGTPQTMKDSNDNKDELFGQSSYFNSLSPEIISIMYGHKSQTEMENVDHNEIWRLNPVSCRTTFHPIVSGNMEDIIISGRSFSDKLDVMLPKGSQYYNKGWVMDLGAGEKRAKRKLLRYGGLGFIDSKVAYYGIFSSGPILFFIPYENNLPISTTHDEDDIINGKELGAATLFRSIIVCEVNEKRGDGECNMQDDVSYFVGGIKVNNIKYINAEGTAYLGKNICVLIPIPKQATATTRENVQQKDKVHTRTNKLNDKYGSNHGKDIGVTLQISVTNKAVSLKKGPCSISHVIWEHGL